MMAWLSDLLLAVYRLNPGAALAPGFRRDSGALSESEFAPLREVSTAVDYLATTQDEDLKKRCKALEAHIQQSSLVRRCSSAHADLELCLCCGGVLCWSLSCPTDCLASAFWCPVLPVY